MRIKNRLKSAYQAFRTVDNAIGGNLEGDRLAKQFLRQGNAPLVQNWSQVLMTDADLYTGFSYAAINNRANAVAQLATENLKTRAKQNIMDAAREKDEVVQHPYLQIIDESKTFANYKFWYDIPTYLDLEGIYYLMAVRTVGEGTNGKKRIGNVQEFKLLNPYEVRRVRNLDTLEIGGYVESHDGLYREIVPEMIIEIQMLNPFSRDNPYGMTDAMKDSQFTLKSAGDYTRHAIANNINAPGIISSDVLLEPERFQNFKSRIVNHEKPGEPLFGNGSGAIDWKDMQIDLNKAALDKVHELNLSSVSATSGVSKTMFGIEQSGVTRDTAKVQKDLFIANHVTPLLQRIIDALNQDYKRYYDADYEKNGYTLYIDSPLGVDRDAEIKDIQIRKESYEVYVSLVNKGYDHELAAKYANGEIGLAELGEPANEPVSTITAIELPETPQKKNEEETEEKNSSGKVTNYNPNHDQDGRFAPGGGGSGIGTVETVESLGNLQQGDGSGFDSRGDPAVASLAEQRSFNKKPAKYTKREAEQLVEQGWQPVYRGYRTDKATKYKKSYSNDDEPRRGYGVFGSGTYMTSNEDVGTFYAGGNTSNVGTYLIKPEAKGISYDKAKKQMISEHTKVIREYTSKAKSLENPTAVASNIKVIYSDTGRWATFKGYDYISAPGPSGGVDLVVLNRGVVGVVE